MRYTSTVRNSIHVVFAVVIMMLVIISCTGCKQKAVESASITPIMSITPSVSALKLDDGKVSFFQVVPNRETIIMTDVLGQRSYYKFRYRDSVDGKVHTCLLNTYWASERRMPYEWQYLFEDFQMINESYMRSRQVRSHKYQIPNKEQLERLINSNLSEPTAKQSLHWNATELNGYMHMPIEQDIPNLVRVQDKIGGDLTYMCSYKGGRWSIILKPEIMAQRACLWDRKYQDELENNNIRSYPSLPTSGKMYNSALEYVMPEGYTGEIQQGPAKLPGDFSQMQGDWAKQKTTQ